MKMKLIEKLMNSRRSRHNPFSSSSNLASSCPSSSSSSSSSSPFRGCFSFSSSTQYTLLRTEEEDEEEDEEERVSIEKYMPMLPTPPDLEWELEQAFRKFDANGDGRNSPTEVLSLFRCMGNDISKEDASRMVQEADQNKDGFVDLREFIYLMTVSPPWPHYRNSHNGMAFQEEDGLEAEDEEDKALRCAFGLFDRDGDGLISAMELYDMLCSLGEEEVSLEGCCQMIQGVDLNQDGVVDFEEFKGMMIGNT